MIKSCLPTIEIFYELFGDQKVQHTTPDLLNTSLGFIIIIR